MYYALMYMSCQVSTLHNFLPISKRNVNLLKSNTKPNRGKVRHFMWQEQSEMKMIKLLKLLQCTLA